MPKRQQPIPNLGDPDAKYDLPAELLTPEKLEAAQQEQRRLAESVNSPYANKSPQDIQRFNAWIIVREVEEMLKSLSLDELSPPAREQYAEALAETGHFGTAARVTKDGAKREFYDDLWQAVLKDDDDICTCPKTDFGGVKKNNRFAEAEVWSHKHDRMMPVIRCNTCGHQNVTALPASIAKERDTRKRNVAFTTGRTLEDARQIIDNLK